MLPSLKLVQLILAANKAKENNEMASSQVKGLLTTLKTTVPVFHC